MSRAAYFREHHAANRERRNAANLAAYHRRRAFSARLQREVRRILVTDRVRRLRACLRTLGVNP